MIQQGGAAMLCTSEPADVARYQMFGWMTGDGWLTEKPTFGLTFGPEDDPAFQALAPIWRDFVGGRGSLQIQANKVRCLSSQRREAKARFLAHGFRPALGPSKRVPACVWTAPADLQIAYLQGLFGADGCVGYDPRPGRWRNAVLLTVLC
jgi:ribonucleoside-diphosphate reductase alpha chain